MKPVVLRSVNDMTEQRCVDLLHLGESRFIWKECRRDPEDPHGWRVIAECPSTGFPTETAAWASACASIPWLKTVAP